MGNTFKKIQTVTVGSGGSATIAFTSIPQTYTDLKIVISARSTTNLLYGFPIKLRFNGATDDTNLSSRAVEGSGTAASSYTNSFIYLNATNGATSTSNVFSSHEVYIPNYTSANNKSVSVEGLLENNGTEAYMSLQAGLWSNTAAITAISIVDTSGGSFVQYTTATLYGVINYTLDNPGGKATGGIVTQDSNYWYHTFTTSGTLNVTSAVTADYLCVAGGGGGGSGTGGGVGSGGGAGGYRTGSLSLTTGNKIVTIGGGGASATNGSNSVFDSITSTGGGYGAGTTASSPAIGGSGGGGYTTGGAPTNGAAGTSGQGNAGGNGRGVAVGGERGGGGGGASAAGANGGINTGGEGGAGTASSISGTSVTYAGGGGGGSYGGSGATGGSGGGGAGAIIGGSNQGASGTVNTGGGAGGSYANTSGGTGGSGIVIVRYAK
jgi:hypothetical protein